MTDTNRSLSELPALIAERRKYESWLVALDARRDTTPAHVFERVESDYQTRLARVVEQLEAHRHVIDEERASVESRIAVLEAEERTRRDERAELELRAHVGELVGDEAESAFKAVDDSINQLVGEKQGLQTRIDELEALLRSATTRRRRRARPGRRSTPTFLPPKRRPRRSAARAPAAARRSSAVKKPVADAGAGEPRRRRLPSLWPKRQSRRQLVRRARVSQHGGRARTAPRSRWSRKSRRDAALVRDERAAESLLAGLANPTTVGTSAEKPLAANVTGNQPIMLRAGTTEQPKTLKCNECGATELSDRVVLRTLRRGVGGAVERADPAETAKVATTDDVVEIALVCAFRDSR